MPDRMSFYIDPIERTSGGSLPASGGNVQLDPIEQQGGRALPASGGFQLDPIEQRGSQSLPQRPAWGAPMAPPPAAQYSELFDIFFGGE